MIRFLTTEEVIVLHEVGIRRWGGMSGGGHRGPLYEGVEAAVQAVKNSYYESVFELAAAYAVYIVQGHVFADGNKRAGALAMLIFLDHNGVVLTISRERLTRLMVELQKWSEEGGPSPDEVVERVAREIARFASRRRS